MNANGQYENCCYCTKIRTGKKEKKEYSHGCSNSVFMKLSESCINLRNGNNKIGRSRLSTYDKSCITYLYESREFNAKKSNSVTNAVYSFTNSNNNKTNKLLDESNDKKGHHYQRDKLNDVFHIYQRSRSKIHKAESKDLSYKAKEPVIIINQLNSNIDVSSVVDELLSDQEFRKVSSLYVVVPTSDDEDNSDSMSRFTTKCVQLSEYKNLWNKPPQPYWPQRRTSNMMDNVAVSLKGKQYFLSGLPTTNPYFKNMDITRDERYNFTPQLKEMKNNKLCQITTPSNMVRLDIRQLQSQNNVVSTDTTLDRPCCCKANPTVIQSSDSEDNEYHNTCTSTVVSQMLMASNCLPEGLVTDSVEYLMKTQRDQALYSPESQPQSSYSTCQINQCCVRGGCCGSRNVPVQHPNRVKFKSPVEQSCTCNPDIIKQMFDQMQAEKLRNMRSTACGECSDSNANGIPAISRPTPGKDFYLRSNQNESMINSTMKKIPIKPIEGTKNFLMNMPRPKFLPKYNSYSVGCQSTFKDNYVVIGPSGKTIPVLGETVPPFPGATRGPVSTAIQNGSGCLKCSAGSPGLRQKAKYFKELSTPEDTATSHFKEEVGLIEVVGPLGGYAAIGSDGVYTQAGHKELRFSTAVGPGNAFKQVDIVNMAVSDNESKADKVNVTVTDETGKTNITVDEVEIDVAKEKSKTSNQIDSDNMTSVEKNKSNIKSDTVNSNGPVDTTNKKNKSNNLLDTSSKKSKSNNLFGKLNLSKTKKKSKPNSQSVQTDKGKSSHTCECILDRENGESKTDYISLDNKDGVWIDPKLISQLRSELSQTTSGFVVNKRGKQNEPVVEIDVSLEDAVRFYATLHPEVLADLFPNYEGLSNIQSCACKSDNCCECPVDIKLSIPQPTSEVRPSILKLEVDEVEQPAIPFKGLRLKMPGKGTGSQGLGNILVFK